ncbi:MAG: cell surface protein [Bacteroidaceae bacterium]|nr:cell surface protein [Bacteroidaceae bacterium]
MKKTTLLIVTLFAFGYTGAQNSPYINKVYDFRPAPGQFVNTLPAWEEGDTEADMIRKANDCLADNNQEMVCLGGFGGYIVFGFDHPVVNVKGEYDLQIDGNAFYAESNPSSTTALGGSSEPGIVMVSSDDNGNGLPDDQWYELAGSEYYKPQTRHNYQITYHRPSADHVATPHPTYRFLTDTTFVRWTANDSTSGYISQIIYHRQNYYPNWIEEDSITFRGTKLANNAVDESGKGTYYVLYCYDWGYADNHPNTTEMAKFNLDWAVDPDGTPVELEQIDFVRVHTAVNQYARWLGETSTEIINAYDLHPDQEPASVRSCDADIPGRATYYDLSGRRVADNRAAHGVYIRKTANKTAKILLK